jgi:hypothetical protein
MTDLDFLAIGLAVDQPEFAAAALEASGMKIFQEIGEGKVGPQMKEFRKDLDRQGRNSTRVSSAFPLYEAVLRALRERNKATARTKAIAALFDGDNRAALDAINLMAEPAPKQLKVV